MTDKEAAPEEEKNPKNDEKDEKKKEDPVQDLSNELCIFRHMYLKRKNELEIADLTVNNLVRECKFWKKQHSTMIKCNLILRDELSSLKQAYHMLGMKARYDAKTVATLKHSEEYLTQERRDVVAVSDKLKKLSLLNTELTTSKMILNTEKMHFLKKIKTTNSKLQKLNEHHKKIQAAISKEQNAKTSKEGRNRAEVESLSEFVDDDTRLLREIDEKLDNRKGVFEKFRKCIEDSSSINTEENQETTSKENSNNQPEGATEQSADQSEVKPSEKKNKAKGKDAKTDPKATVEDMKAEVTERQSVVQELEKKNKHLEDFYMYLHRRMTSLKNESLQIGHSLQLKEMELEGELSEASDTLQLVQRKRRRFHIPPRKESVEVDARINSQMQEISSMREILRLCFEYHDEDLECQETFLTGMMGESDVEKSSEAENPQNAATGQAEAEDGPKNTTTVAEDGSKNATTVAEDGSKNTTAGQAAAEDGSKNATTVAEDGSKNATMGQVAAEDGSKNATTGQVAAEDGSQNTTGQDAAEDVSKS